MSQPATTLVTATGSYRVVPDAVLRAQALAVVALDRADGVRATSLTPLTSAHITSGHLVLTGRADRALPHLATAPVTLTVRLDRPGRPRQLLEITIPAGSPLPWRTSALLDADPLTLTGRVREAAFPHPPIPQALVTVTGAAGIELLALRTPLTQPHSLGTTVQLRTLAGGATTTTDGAAPAGTDRLRLTSTAGIGPASVLAVGEPERVEHVRALTTEPGDVVVLRTPLARSLADGAPVRRHTLGAIGATTTLARPGQPADGGLVTLAALTGDVVEIVDGDRTELRALGALTATDGGWRLDGIPAVPAISLLVSAPGFTDSGPVVHPLEGGPLDVELEP